MVSEYWERVKRAFGPNKQLLFEKPVINTATVAFVNDNNILIKRHYNYLIAALVTVYIERVLSKYFQNEQSYVTELVTIGCLVAAAPLVVYSQTKVVNWFLFILMLTGAFLNYRDKYNDIIQSKSSYKNFSLLDTCLEIFVLETYLGMVTMNQPFYFYAGTNILLYLILLPAFWPKGFSESGAIYAVMLVTLLVQGTIRFYSKRDTLNIYIKKEGTKALLQEKCSACLACCRT